MKGLMKYSMIILFLLVIVFGTARSGVYKASPGPDVSPGQDAGDNFYPLQEAGKELLESLPWAGDTEFQEAVRQNNTPLLMAEYHVTLPDPLPGEMHNVGLAADFLSGTVVMSGKIFSQNCIIGPYTSERGYQKGIIFKGTQMVESTGGGVCKIASLLYNVAITSNLPIIERYNHSMTVPYVPLGQDATVYYGAKDLRFLNNTPGPILIMANTVGTSLYIAIYGQTKPPTVVWHHETLKHIQHQIIYRENYDLPKGTKKVIIPGQDGYLVKSWLTIEYNNGETEDKDLGSDWYNALPEVVEQGPE